MPKQVTTAASNRYCQARLKAGKYNEKLLTRATAADYLPGVTEDSLKKYELDIVRPPNDIVALMADAYNAPELRSWYCSNECPLGKDCREISEMPPERALLRLRNSVAELDDSMEQLAMIMDDGIIDNNEKTLLPGLHEQFVELRRRIDENLAILERASKKGCF